MRILFIGSKDRGVRCLNALLEAGKNVVGVVTEDDDDPDAFWDESVARAANEHALNTYSPDNVNDEQFLSTLRDLDPDLVTMAGFSQVLGSDVLAIPDEGVINLHAGKLPDYRGGSPMNWMIINGEETGTATIHYATERIDAGRVLVEREFDIGIEETIADVRDKTLAMFPSMLVDVVGQLEAGTANPRENNVNSGTYWGSRMPQDGRIDWQVMSEKEVYDFVRALTHPYPGAFTTYEGRKLFVWDAELLDEEIKHQPGRICMKRGDGRVVAAKDRGVLLKTVQPAGSDEVDAATALDRGDYLQ